MAIYIQRILCPQCGASRCRKVADSPNLYACSSCGAEFVLSDSNAPKELRVVHSLEPGQFAKLGQLKWALAVGAGLLMLLVLLPFVRELLREHAPAAPNPGRLQASTLYHSGGGKIEVLQVLEAGDARSDVYQIVASDLDTGKPLAEPQQIGFQRNTQSRSPKLRHFPDGGIYLILNGQKLLRFDPASHRFASLDEELVNRHPGQLGVGVAQIEFPPRDRPGMFIVTSNSGERYHVHWPTREILLQSEAYQRFHGRPWASYTETRPRVGFAELHADKHRGTYPWLLVRYEQKVRPGEFEYLPPLNLYSTEDSAVRSAPQRYELLTPEWAYRRDSLQEAGVTGLAAVPPVQKRFRADVLAANAQRVLIAYNPTPVTDQGRVLQLLDAQTLQPVWSRPVEELPQITRNGTYVAADALPMGFYITSDDATPSLLLSNGGTVLHDFRPPQR
ncbi:MAG: hypothetical protein ACN6O3_04960 [Comamonas sp.]